MAAVLNSEGVESDVELLLEKVRKQSNLKDMFKNLYIDPIVEISYIGSRTSDGKTSRLNLKKQRIPYYELDDE